LGLKEFKIQQALHAGGSDQLLITEAVVENRVSLSLFQRETIGETGEI
jgi:hypothetical protein